jgi:uroporphyrinogen-III synthase
MSSSKRVLITRSTEQSSALAEDLRALGLEPILIPTIELTAPTTYAPLDAAINQLDTFNWLLFTSANAVEAFAHRLSSANTFAAAENRVPRGFSLGSHATGKGGASAPGVCLLPSGLKLAAIGPATARAIETYLHTTPNLIPPQAIAESFADALLAAATPGDRFLLVRAETARNILEEHLKRAEYELTIAPAYRTIAPASSIAQLETLFANPANYPAAITFTSSSTAQNLINLLKESGLTLPPEIPRISIGRITTQTLRELGYPPTAESPQATIPALAQTVFQSLISNP